MTILFLISYFQGIATQNVTIFYLYFSIFIFITYGFIILGINQIQKSDIEPVIPKSKQLEIQKTKLKADIYESLLQGKTLQVYWYFFTHNHAGIREIQKALNISSSGTVSYQINKLLKAGIISKVGDEGKYSLNEEVKMGILKFFIRIGNRVIPRISLYLIIYILGFIIYFLLALIYIDGFLTDPVSLLLLLFLILGSVIFILESLKIRKLKPT
ncbi:MAG: winged helix-turn-helix domain-containing protein [Promethearchaeota archaeon]